MLVTHLSAENMRPKIIVSIFRKKSSLEIYQKFRKVG